MTKASEKENSQESLLDYFNQHPQPLKVIPNIQSYVWGALAPQSKILKFLNRSADYHEHDQPIAEMWFGAHPKINTMVVINQDQLPLDQFIKKAHRLILGEHQQSMSLLLKMLDAIQPLSWQMHERFGPQAKNETWLFPINQLIDYSKGPNQLLAELYVGFQLPQDMDQAIKEEQYQSAYMDALTTGREDRQGNKIKAFSNHIKLCLEKNQLELYLNEQKQPDDVKKAIGLDQGYLTINIPGATVHALIKGMAFEIQEMSDKTLRLFDYGRNQPDRPLHIDEAKSKIDFTPRAALEYIVQPLRVNANISNLVMTKAYSLDRINLSHHEASISSQVTIHTNGIYQLIIVTSGKGQLNYQSNEINSGKLIIQHGDLLVIPAIIDHYSLSTDSNLVLFNAVECTNNNSQLSSIRKKRQFEFWNQGA